MGDHHVGVRCDDRATLGMLEQQYRPWLVDDDRGDRDLAVFVGERGPGRGRALPALFHGRCALLRSRTVDRVLHRLDKELGALTRADGERVGIVGFGAFTRNASAVLVPSCAFQHGVLVERLAADAWAMLVEPVGLQFDPETSDVVVGHGLAGLNSRQHRGTGRLEVKAILWEGWQRGNGERASHALARLLTRIDHWPDRGRWEFLAALADLQVRAFQTIGFTCGHRRSIEEALALLD